MKLKIVLEGEEHEVEVEPGQTILEIALDEDLDAPYSCESGVCGTCKAKVIEGQIEMESDDALSEDEIDDGFILTCQSHVMSDAIITYDFD